MITRIIIVALIGGLAYLNYTNPSEQDHKDAIIAEMQQTWPIPEELQEQIWRKADYTNFMVCSFLKTTEGSVMISTGYLNKVKIVNDNWLEETRKNLNRKLEY